MPHVHTLRLRNGGIWDSWRANLLEAREFPLFGSCTEVVLEAYAGPSLGKRVRAISVRGLCFQPEARCAWEPAENAAFGGRKEIRRTLLHLSFVLRNRLKWNQLDAY